jgi:hypothetical protein
MYTSQNANTELRDLPFGHSRYRSEVGGSRLAISSRAYAWDALDCGYVYGASGANGALVRAKMQNLKGFS